MTGISLGEVFRGRAGKMLIWCGLRAAVFIWGKELSGFLLGVLVDGGSYTNVGIVNAR